MYSAPSVLHAIHAHSFQTNDVSQANAYISTHVTDHRLDVLRRGSRIAFDCRRWSIGEIQVCDFSYGDLEVAVRLSKAPDAGVFLVVPLAGEVTIHRGSNRFVLRPGGAMVFNTPDDNEIRFVDSPGFRNINLCVSRASLAHFLREEFGLPLGENIAFDVQPVTTTGGLSYLLDYIRWLCSQFDDPEASLVARGRHIARHAHDMLLSQLISCVRNNYQDMYGARNACEVAPGYIRKAEEYMRAHATDPLTMAEVAHAVGIASRTLQLGFQRHRNYSAGEFLRNERLALARQALAGAKQRGRSVTDVALECGFVHLSRFSSMYRRRFGEKPSETLHKGA